ncbi:MAG: ferritin-like domain-containing protein [Candidatus Korobacteraceae bacterium]
MDLAEITTLASKALNRRKFLKGSGMAGLGIASATLIGGGLSPLLAQTLTQNKNPLTAVRKNPTTIHDTPTDIFTAALVAEDLATTFYYNALVGPVIQDPNLAGPGGSPHNPNPNDSNPGNVAYLQAAFTEEIDHADLMRSLLGIGSSQQDPYQTFYFPAGTFNTLSPFLALLDALENAFIGAYLVAVQEFAVLAVNGANGYTSDQLEYFAKVAASICAVESEHRVLGRVIGSMNPANQKAYEQTDGLTSLANGPNSAVDALAPFLNPATGPAYSLQQALANQGSVIYNTPIQDVLPDSTLY